MVQLLVVAVIFFAVRGKEASKVIGWFAAKRKKTIALLRFPKICIFAPLSASRPERVRGWAAKHIKGVESTSYLRLL